MKFSRDSVLLWALAGAALVGYFVTAKVPPTQWDYMQWLQFASAVFGYLVAKLQNSPLPSSKEIDAGVRANGKALSMLLVLGLTGAMLAGAGCGTNPPPAGDPTANLSAEGRASYNATKVVKSLDLLRDIVAEGEKQTPKVFSPDTVLKVVAYHRKVVRTIGTVPDGWKAVALQGLDELKGSVPAAEWQKMQPWVSLLTVLYEQLVTGGGPDPALLQSTLALDDALLAR